MSTNALFNDMLKRYMPYKLLVESMKKKNYFWNKVNKMEGWKGGVLEFPFEGGEYSSLQFGSLTASNDIADGTYVMGTISAQPELWGTMKFNEKDLDRHGDLEKSYLAVVPGKIDQFVTRMAERISISLLNDGSIAKATADGLITGVLAVDHPENFTLMEKVVVDDGNSAAVSGYVVAIDMEGKTITLNDARSAGSPVDLTPYTVAQNAKVYLPGSQSAGFNSLAQQLLSAANGGSATIAGQTKLSYPILQAQQHDGSSITGTNIVDKLYDHYFDTIQLGKSEADEILVSFKHFKNAAKVLQSSKDYLQVDKKAGYGFRSITLLGPEGEMTLTGLRDMPDDKAYILDWKGLDFHGDQFFERKRHLNGDEFFLVRNTSGYEYIVDIKLYGDLVVSKPSKQGIIHSIDY